MLINDEDRQIMESFIEMNIRMSGEKDEEQIKKRMKDSDEMDRAMRKVISTRCFQKVRKLCENNIINEDLHSLGNRLDVIFRVLPHEFLKNVDEWNNNMEFSEIQLYGTSMKEIVCVLENDDTVFLTTLECFAMSFWFKEYPELFLLHALGQMPPMWNKFQEKIINRRDNWRHYHDLLKKTGRTGITEESIQRYTLLLDFADKIMREREMQEPYSRCLESAVVAIENIPKELWVNISECIDGKPLSTVKYDGIDVVKFIELECPALRNCASEAILQYARRIQSGLPFSKEKTNSKRNLFKK